MSDRADAAPPLVPLSVPHCSGTERAFVAECFDTNWLSTAGPFVDRLEHEIAALLGVEHAVATASGTAALHLALLAVGVGPGDKVLVPAISFVATANAVRYCGAEPIFVDVEPAHATMDAALVRAFLETECDRVGGAPVERASGRPVKALMPVHCLGHPAEMEILCALAAEHGLAVVEDAAESLGSRLHGRHMGTFGDAGCISLNGNKIVTGGAGGLVVTRRADLAERVRYLSTQAKDDPVESVHGAVGFNYRLPNLLAAVACAQIAELDRRVAEKRRIAAQYDAVVTALPGLTPLGDGPGVESNRWLYTIRVDPHAYGRSRRDLQAAFDTARIVTRPLWTPLFANPPHRSARVIGGETARTLQDECLSLPSSVGLSASELARVTSVLHGSDRAEPTAATICSHRE